MKQTKFSKLLQRVRIPTNEKSASFDISLQILKASAYLTRTHLGFIARANNAKSHLKDDEHGVLAGPKKRP